MRFILIFLLSFSLNSVAQNYYNGIDKYKTDTTVLFKEGVNEYSFLWSNKKQGFFWDTISNKIDCYHVKFKILNDTEDTIHIKKIGGGDGALLYQRVDNSNKSRLLLPNEIMTIKVTQYSSKYRYWFNKSLNIQVVEDGSSKGVSIKSWGYFVKDYPSKFNKNDSSNLNKSPEISAENNDEVRHYNDTIQYYYLNFDNEDIKFNWDTISKTSFSRLKSSPSFSFSPFWAASLISN